jgi:hypothetical protein
MFFRVSSFVRPEPFFRPGPAPLPCTARRTIIGMTQGLLARKATQPPLVDMVDTLCKSDMVEKIKTGHLLRCLKQLALRGKARQFTATGLCGAQKLVVTGDWLFMVEHSPHIFPGARLSSSDTAKRHLGLLVEVLRRPDLLPVLPVRVVGELMGIDWQKSGRKLPHHHSFGPLVDSAGWRFEKGSGRKGSRFLRKGTEPATEATPSTCPAAPETVAELG